MYCTRSDIEDAFGIGNVLAWADLDNDADETKIEARIDRAIAVADARIDDTLRTSDVSFQLPLTSTTLTDVAAVLTGYWLSRSRGTRELDDNGKPISRLTGARNEALETLNLIASGKLKPAGVV
jgi:hypothetical protein